MCELRHLEIGERVKVLQGPIVRDAVIKNDLGEGQYRLDVEGILFTTQAIYARPDIYTAEDTAELIEDLRGLIEDAEAAIEQLQAIPAA